MERENDTGFWRLAIGGTLLLAIGVLAVMFSATFDDPGDTFRLEAAKLLLQFVLAGVGGALILGYLNQRRDRAEHVAADKMARAGREAALKADAEARAAGERAAEIGRAAVRRAALQELIRQIGDAHRRLKVVKRQLRAAISRKEPDPRGAPDRPYRIPASSFERAMDALLSAQIASEEVRDRIEVSVDLLEKSEIDRIRMALRYGARYFHDVYEDYEHGRIKREGEEFLITPTCNNMHNFLFAREPPVNLPPGHQEELHILFATMHEEARDLAQRYDALKKIEQLRQADCPGAEGGPRKRRYRAIATECFALAADELRQALWHTCARDIAAEAGAAEAPAAQAAGVSAVA